MPLHRLPLVVFEEILQSRDQQTEIHILIYFIYNKTKDIQSIKPRLCTHKHRPVECKQGMGEVGLVMGHEETIASKQLLSAHFLSDPLLKMR